jgi:alpha-1,2-mannosyltransferase
MAFLVIILSLLVASVVSVVFLRKTLHLLAELVGRRLRHSSRTRRELLLDRVAAETKTFKAERKTKNTEDDDWEKIAPSPKGSPSSQGQANAEWNGVVGFFHPFWYNRKYDSLGSLLTEF